MIPSILKQKINFLCPTSHPQLLHSFTAKFLTKKKNVVCICCLPFLFSPTREPIPCRLSPSPACQQQAHRCPVVKVTSDLHWLSTGGGLPLLLEALASWLRVHSGCLGLGPPTPALPGQPAPPSTQPRLLQLPLLLGFPTPSHWAWAVWRSLARSPPRQPALLSPLSGNLLPTVPWCFP